MNNQALRIENLTFSFSQQSSPFFSNISFTLEKNKVHILRGANGVGKSTLFRLLSGNVSTQEQLHGTMTTAQQTIVLKTNTHAPKTVIKVVQQTIATMLADQLTVEQNLRCAALPQYPTLHGLPSFEPFAQLLEHAKIALNKPVHLLSGGQKQILAILMILQKPAPVLLLDEPTSALDPQNATLVLNFLQELATLTGLAVLIITHDKEMATTYQISTYFELYYEEKNGTRTIRTVTTPA